MFKNVNNTKNYSENVGFVPVYFTLFVGADCTNLPTIVFISINGGGSGVVVMILKQF